MNRFERLTIVISIVGLLLMILFGLPTLLTFFAITYQDIMPTTYFEITKAFIIKFWWAYWLLSIYFAVQFIALVWLRYTIRKKEIEELEQLRETERAATRSRIAIEGKYDSTRTAIWKLYGEYINGKCRDTEQEYLWEQVKHSFTKRA